MTSAPSSVPTVGVLQRSDATVGEGPTVTADGGTVHWVDIPAGAVHTTDVAEGTTRSLAVETMVGAVALRAVGGFVAATREGFATIDPDGVLDTRLAFLEPGTRMNDAECDAAGRFWAGSTAIDFTPGAGALHVLMPDWTFRTLLDGLTLPNGLGWSPDGATLYLVDSLRRTVSSYAVDPSGTDLGEARVLHTFSGEDGLPDGLTVDLDGDLWIAMWGGSRIVRMSPDGVVTDSVPVPVLQPSSCAFGGPAFDRLLVTSATQDITSGPDRLDGSLLVIAGLGARGAPAPVFSG